MWSKQSKDQGPDRKILHRYKLNILNKFTSYASLNRQD